ncbi:MAG: vWA domain-containing protein [Hyphomicrobiaceae bacterium]
MVHKVHVSMVLDRSGSMEDARVDAVAAVNRYLDHLRNDRSLNARMSIVVFDSEGIDAIRDRVPVAACADVALDEYEPGGATPLLDAVGYSVGLVDCLTGKDERRIMAIVTDGLENASREYTRVQLKGLLERKQREDGWLIMYLGAGHDSFGQAGQIGIARRHTADFSLNAFGETADVLKSAGHRFLGQPKRLDAPLASGLTGDERLRLIQGRQGTGRGLTRRTCSSVRLNRGWCADAYD